MAGAAGAWDGQQELVLSQEVELEPPRLPSLPGKTQRVTVPRVGSTHSHHGSLDPGTPGGHPPRPPDSALIYSNVGELRAHLVPRKATRGEGAGRPPSEGSLDPLPPPLPKKQLQRAESLPEQGPPRHPWRGDPPPWASSIPHGTPAPRLRREEGAPSSIPPWDSISWGHKKPLTKSQSLGEPVTWSSPQRAPSPSPAELTFGTADGELGQLLESPGGVGGVVLGCQAGTLARLSARIQEELVGPEERRRLLEAELAGKGWAELSLLATEPCCETTHAWFFQVGFSFQQTPLVLAAKVPKPCCAQLGVQSCLGGHCSLQRLVGRFTDRLPEELLLPGSPGQQSQSPAGEEPAHPAHPPGLQILLSPDVPYQNLASFVKDSQGLHRTSPGHYERLACLLLLQVCLGLEHLQEQNMGRGDLCPKNLLLVQCPRPPRSQQGKEASPGLSLPRLLISSSFKVKDKPRPCSTSQEQDWPEGGAAPPSLVADELNVGMLIYQILHVDISLENTLGFRSNRLPEIPSLSIYSTGLKRLATLLLHRDPCNRVSIQQARSILQVLLWGPRQELFARRKKTLPLLRGWLELKRALLLLRFAEHSAGAGWSPGLEDWLCCQYFQEVTEHTLCQVTQALYSL